MLRGRRSDQPLPENLGEQTAPIVAGKSDRAPVRSLLGQPWLSSDHWRFDLFRSTDRSSAIVFLVT